MAASYYRFNFRSQQPYSQVVRPVSLLLTTVRELLVLHALTDLWYYRPFSFWQF